MPMHQHGLILRLPVRRIWLYIRQLRVISRLGSSYSSKRRDLVRLIVLDEAEDGVVLGTFDHCQHSTVLQPSI